MSDNFLDEDGGKAFALFLETNTTLETLKVNNCKLGQKSCELMIAAFDKNKKMKIIDLQAQGCDFSEEGMKLLSEVLKRMNSL